MTALVPPETSVARRPDKQLNLVNLLVIGGLHLVAGGVIVALFAGYKPSFLAWMLGLALWIISNLGVTVGYHRGFTHRGYDMGPALKAVLLICAALSLQGDAMHWISDHRRHHKYADVPGLDPHSPLEYSNRFKSLWHAHCGWLIWQTPLPDGMPRVARDLENDALMVWQRRWYVPLALMGFVAPALIGGFDGLGAGGWAGFGWGALDGLLIGGVLRVVWLYQLTWSVNSICHWIGTRARDSRGRRYEGDDSRNNVVIGLLGMGEGWHNNHHADPTCAFHGRHWWQIDGSKYVIVLLGSVGLLRNIRRPRPLEFKPSQYTRPERTPVDKR